MWYVIQVASGQEQAVCNTIKRAADVYEKTNGVNPLKECFVPMYQCERKFHGEYKLVRRNLFPGYVLAITDNIEEVNAVLHKIAAFAKILGNDMAFIPLERSEMAFINSFTVEKHRVIPISRAVAEGDTVRVLEGPMVGHEGWIKKINRRKGTARIETEMFGRKVCVEIGLAVVTKQ